MNSMTANISQGSQGSRKKGRGKEKVDVSKPPEPPDGGEAIFQSAGNGKASATFIHKDHPFPVLVRGLSNFSLVGMPAKPKKTFKVLDLLPDGTLLAEFIEV